LRFSAAHDLFNDKVGKQTEALPLTSVCVNNLSPEIFLLLPVRAFFMATLPSILAA
jgi:hypothetical protein